MTKASSCGFKHCRETGTCFLKDISPCSDEAPRSNAEDTAEVTRLLRRAGVVSRGFFELDFLVDALVTDDIPEGDAAA